MGMKAVDNPQAKIRFGRPRRRTPISVRCHAEKNSPFRQITVPCWSRSKNAFAAQYQILKAVNNGLDSLYWNVRWQEYK